MTKKPSSRDALNQMHELLLEQRHILASLRPHARKKTLARIAGVVPGTRLYRLLGELISAHDFTSFPQTDLATLVRHMETARGPEEWSRILAIEVLVYLERSYAAGHALAPADAWVWCRAHRLPVPEWLRDSSRIGRRGKRSSLTRINSFLVDFVRFWAVKKAELVIATEKDIARLDAKLREAERNTPGLKFDRTVKPESENAVLRGEDKFEYAKGFLPDWATTRNDSSTKAIRKSYDKLRKNRVTYFDSPSLMYFLSHLAPTVHKLLLSYPLSSPELGG